MQICWMMQGLKQALQSVLRVTGLLEMMFDVLSAWIDDFLTDIDQLETDSPADAPGSAQTSPRSHAAQSPVQSMPSTAAAPAMRAWLLVCLGDWPESGMILGTGLACPWHPVSWF